MIISKPKTSYLFILLCAKVLSQQEEPREQWTVSWNAPILSGTSGYGSEALSFLLGLNHTLSSSNTTTTPLRHDWKIAAGVAHGDSIDWDYFHTLSPNLHNFLGDASANQQQLNPERTIVICHSEPGAWSVPTPMYHSGSPCPPPLPPGSSSKKKKWHAVIGRTMFETDRLPTGWQHRLHSVSEVWVPTQHHKLIFERDGVTNTPIVVVGQGVDTQTWNNNASRIKPLEWSVIDPDGHCKEHDYKFLSVFKWEDRKGHDVLFKSFWRAFYNNPLDDTTTTDAGGACLVVVTSLYHENANRVWNDLQDYWIHATQNHERRSILHPKFHPGVVLLSKMPTQDLVRLYQTMDAFVLPSRGEGWGRPYMEAMAMGLPVIATNWSGPTAFVTEENGYLLPITGLVEANLDAFPGHRWAEPDGNALKEIMVRLRDHPEDGKVKGNRGNQDVIERWSHRAMADVVARELERLTIGVDAVDRSSSNEEL